jgi:hypothetical protein
VCLILWHREGAQLHDDLQVAHLGPDLLYHPILDPEDEDTRFEDALISRRDVEESAFVRGPALAADDGFVFLGEDVMDGPLSIYEGRRVPPQLFSEGLAPMRVVHTALSVGHEVPSDEIVHGVQVAAGEEVVEPALDDGYVLVEWYGVAPSVRREPGQLAMAYPWRSR